MLLLSAVQTWACTANSTAAFCASAHVSRLDCVPGERAPPDGAADLSLCFLQGGEWKCVDAQGPDAHWHAAQWSSLWRPADTTEWFVQDSAPSFSPSLHPVGYISPSPSSRRSPLQRVDPGLNLSRTFKLEDGPKTKNWPRRWLVLSTLELQWVEKCSHTDEWNPLVSFVRPLQCPHRLSAVHCV